MPANEQGLFLRSTPHLKGFDTAGKEQFCFTRGIFEYTSTGGLMCTMYWLDGHWAQQGIYLTLVY